MKPSHVTIQMKVNCKTNLWYKVKSTVRVKRKHGSAAVVPGCSNHDGGKNKIYSKKTTTEAVTIHDR